MRSKGFVENDGIHRNRHYRQLIVARAIVFTLPLEFAIGRSADLGQKEAELEEISEEELRHMEGGKAAEAAVEKKRNI